MIQALKRLVNSGTSHCSGPNEIRLVRTVNIFALITVLGLLVGFINTLFRTYDYPLYFELSIFVCAIGSLILNARGYLRTAVWFFLLIINIAVFYVCEYYHLSTGCYLFYFPLVLAVALFHIPGDSIWRTMGYYLITMVFFIISLLFDFEFIYNSNNSAEDNSYLLMYNIGMSVVICAMEILMMLNLLNGQNKELSKHLVAEKNLNAAAAKSLREKEVLLSEVHHRVKNNLAIINGLLNLQKNKTNNPEAATILEDSRNRIISMSLVHEKLYKSNDFSGIEIGNYLTELSEGIIKGTGNKFLKFESNTETIKIPVAIAIPVGLMVNESIVNSIKHAFNNTGHINHAITLKVKKENSNLFIRCSDNGKGFSKGFDASNEETLGVLIIQSLAEQLDGKVKFFNENGACVEMCIPLINLN